MTNSNNPKILSDEQLLKYFVQGDTRILASNNLRLDYKANTAQISHRKTGEVLAIFKPLEKPYCIYLRENNQYEDLLIKVFLENKFIPLTGLDKHNGFVIYQQHEIPNGYQINYTDTVALWKTWWPTRRHQRSYAIMIDILVFFREQWYPIQDMMGHDGIFYIKTLVGEISLAPTDKLVWLNKVAKIQGVVTSVSTIHKPANTETFVQEPTGGTSVVIPPRQNSGFIDKSNNTTPIVPTPSLSTSSNFSRKDADETIPSHEIKENLDQLKSQAMKVLSHYLQNGEIETQTEVIKDSKGEILSVRMTTTKKPCPQWVINYIFKHP